MASTFQARVLGVHSYGPYSYGLCSYGLYRRILGVHIVMACIVMAYIVMACIGAFWACATYRREELSSTWAFGVPARLYPRGRHAVGDADRRVFEAIRKGLGSSCFAVLPWSW